MKDFGYTCAAEIDCESWKYSSALVDKGWAEAGVTCCTVPGIGENKYWINGKEVSRKDAFRQALKTRGWNQVAIDCFEFSDYTGDFKKKFFSASADFLFVIKFDNVHIMK